MAPPTTEERIEQLLDQLESPYLTEGDIEKIQKKVDLLKSAT